MAAIAKVARVAGVLLASTVAARCIDGPLRTSVPAQRGSRCAAVWDVTGTAFPGSLPGKPWGLRCVDGDPSCDADGMSNGVCAVQVSVCIEQPLNGCTPAPVSHVQVVAPRQLRHALPKHPAIGPGCRSLGTLQLPMIRRRGRPGPSRPVPLTLKATSAGRAVRNRLEVQCVPPGELCLDEVPGGPGAVRLRVPQSGGSLAAGPAVHSSAIPGSTTLTLCLVGCDASTRAHCTGIGEITTGGLNGPSFGSPQPLVVQGLPFCLVHRFAHDLCGDFQLDTGAASVALSLLSELYLGPSPAEPCPVCETDGRIGSVGRCSAGARNPGASCRLEAVDPVRGSGLSSACIPPASQLATSVPVEITLTTGASSLPAGPLPCHDQTVRVGCGSESCDATCTGDSCVAVDPTGRCVTVNGGVAQACCSNATAIECFPADRPITTTGAPVIPQPPWPDPAYPKTATGMVLAGIACVDPPKTVVSGLPDLAGPWVMTLPADTLTVFGSF